MAAGRLLLPGLMPAVDSNGDPIPNAKVYFYFNKTSTLAPVYSDESLNVRIPNPVEANATGRFPAVWADGEVLYSASVEAPYGPAGVPFTYDNLSASLAAEIVLTEAAEAAANDAEVAYQNILDAIQAAQDADGDAALAGAISGDAAGTAAANLVVGNKVDLDAGNIIDWDVFKKGARIVTPNILSLKNIPSGSVQSIFVEGRLSNNDGYAGDFTWLSGDQSTGVANDASSGVWVAPNGSDGSTGAWKRVYSDTVDIRWFGVDGTGANNDTPAIAAAMYVASGAKVDCSGVEKLGIGSTVILDDGANLDGGNFKCTLVALPSLSGDMVKTRDWDTLYGNGDAFAAGVLERVRLAGFIIDGQYQSADRSAYIRTAGHGVLIYARKPEWDLRVYNVPGKGFHSYCPSGNGPVPMLPGYARQLNGRLYVHQTKEEGIIWEGPVDVAVGPIFQTAAGSRIAADDFNGKVPSPTYGATNGGQTDGIVLEDGAEFSLIHAWGNFAGCGFVQYGGRLHTETLIVESNHFGGVKLLGGYGMVNAASVHRNGGFDDDATADFIHNSSGSGSIGFTFGQLLIHQANPVIGRGIRDRFQLGANSRFFRCDSLHVASNSEPGHGVNIMSGAANYRIKGSVTGVIGSHRDSGPSCALVRDTTAFGHVDLDVTSCSQVFRSGSAPQNEKVAIRFECASGAVAFSGTTRTNVAQEWDISGRIGTQWKGSKARLVFTFDSTVTTEQEVTVAHNLIAAPSYGRMTDALVDTPTKLSLSQQPKFMVSDYDATSVKVVFKVDTASGANTTPRIWVTAEV